VAIDRRTKKAMEMDKNAMKGTPGKTGTTEPEDDKDTNQKWLTYCPNNPYKWNQTEMEAELREDFDIFPQANDLYFYLNWNPYLEKSTAHVSIPVTEETRVLATKI